MEEDYDDDDDEAKENIKTERCNDSSVCVNTITLTLQQIPSHAMAHKNSIL
jgi:hypothetical protein